MERNMRRRMLLAGLWLGGVATSLAVAFGAIATVARGVAPPMVSRLTPAAVEHDLAAPRRDSSPVTTAAPTSPTTHGTPTTVGATVPRPQPPPSVMAPTSDPQPSTGSPPPTAPFAATQQQPASSDGTATATTSPGATVWTRCTAPDSIAFVAAVPRNGWQRVRDVESATTVEQWFANGRTISKVQAQCSNGVVNAGVETESDSGGD